MTSTDNGTIRIHFEMSFKSFERNPESMIKILDELISKSSKNEYFDPEQSSSDWQLTDKSEIEDETMSRKRIFNQLRLKSISWEEKVNCLKLTDPNDHESSLTTEPVCQIVNSEIESIYSLYDCAFKVKSKDRGS